MAHVSGVAAPHAAPIAARCQKGVRTATQTAPGRELGMVIALAGISNSGDPGTAHRTEKRTIMIQV